MNALLAMTLASIKMYFRNFGAIFFTLIFPAIFLVVFGYINSNDTVRIDVALVNESQSELAGAFIAGIEELSVDEASEDSQDDKLFVIDRDITDRAGSEAALNDGELSAAIILPSEFGQANTDMLPAGEVEILIDGGNATFADLVRSVSDSILANLNNGVNEQLLGQAPVSTFSSSVATVQSEDIGGIDYLVPGIIGFSLMSLGVFSITEGFIQLKTNGSLRRLKVAPINPISFLAAQSLTRLIMTILNVLTMLLIAILLFDYDMLGNIFYFMIVATLGTIMFLGFGYAIAGWAKDGNQAAPLSNIIFFPMMFLSGTFFPREAFPEWIIPISDYLPLTYVADGLREISANSASILDLGPNLLGIAVWTVLIYFIAVRVFRWE